MTGAQQFNVRIYYEDTDAGGIVYYANYLKFAERARTEALRDIGIEQQSLREVEKIGFVVKRCVMEFFKPAMLDDLLTIETRLHDIGKASLEMRQTIRRGEQILVTLEVTIAVVGDGMKPIRMPESVQQRMQSLLG